MIEIGFVPTGANDGRVEKPFLRALTDQGARNQLILKWYQEVARAYQSANFPLAKRTYQEMQRMLGSYDEEGARVMGIFDLDYAEDTPLRRLTDELVELTEPGTEISTSEELESLLRGLWSILSLTDEECARKNARLAPGVIFAAAVDSPIHAF